MTTSPFDIYNLKNALPLGGARPTLFRVNLVNPFDPSADGNLQFLVRAASIPDSQLGVIQLPFMGRFLKLHGDRNFGPWATTIINDEDFKARNALETWSSVMNGMSSNIQDPNADYLAYLSTATVTQLGKSGQELRTYAFDGIWPQALGPINLDWGQQDTVEEYTVTWQYQSWTVVGGNTGSPQNQ